MKLSEYCYDLPKELIAYYPIKERDEARLMVLNREGKTITEKVFKNVSEYLHKGDCLVLNDTRVMPVRFYGRRKTGAKVEILLVNCGAKDLHALVRPSRRVKDGEKILLEGGIEATVSGSANSKRIVHFNVPLDEVLKGGHMPLPPYIMRDDNTSDAEDYQTVYASRSGASASPTAGLHFTQRLLDEIRGKGVSIVYVTLHISYGTFAPVTADDIEQHVMHAEYFELTQKAAEMVNATKVSGGRVFAVGTSSMRVLESAAKGYGKVEPASGETNLFIYPGYKNKIVDGIITNFHWPHSTLLMLVSAFAGRDFIIKAYQKAIESRFRFFSYGDAMLIL